MTERTCAQCGASLEGRDARTKFCTTKCRMAHLRDQRRAEGLTADGKPRKTAATDEAVQQAIESSLSKSAKERLEAATRRRMKDLDWEVEQRAQQLYRERMRKRLTEVMDDVEEVGKRIDRHLKVQRRDKLLTLDEYKVLRMVLHPNGNPSEDKHRQAWEIWEKLGLVPLTNEDMKRIEADRKMLEELSKQMGL